jgi:hypothetical protein
MPNRADLDLMPARCQALGHQRRGIGDPVLIRGMSERQNEQAGLCHASVMPSRLQ